MPFFLLPLLGNLVGGAALRTGIMAAVRLVAGRFIKKQMASQFAKTLGKRGLGSVKNIAKRFGGKGRIKGLIKDAVKYKIYDEMFGGDETSEEKKESTADLGDAMMVSESDSPGNVYNMNLQPFAEALEDNSVSAWTERGGSIAATLLPRYGETPDNSEIMSRLTNIERIIGKQNEIIESTAQEIADLNERIRTTELQDNRDADEADREKGSIANRFLGRVKTAAKVAGLAALESTGVLSAVGALGTGLMAFAGAGAAAQVGDALFNDDSSANKSTHQLLVEKAAEQQADRVDEPDSPGSIMDFLFGQRATQYDPNEGTTKNKGPRRGRARGKPTDKGDLGDATKLETVQLTKVHQNNYIRHIRTIENVNQEMINIHKEYGMPQTNPEEFRSKVRTMFGNVRTDELDVNVTADDDNGIQNISVQVEREGGVRFYRMNRIDEKYFTLIRKKIVAEELADQSLRKIEKIKIDSGEIVPDENWNRPTQTISTVTDPTDENAIPRTVVTNTASSSDEYRAMIAQSLVPDTNLHDISNFSDVGHMGKSGADYVQSPTGRDMGASIRRQGVGVLETGLVQPDIKPDEMSIWDRIKGMLPSLTKPVLISPPAGRKTDYHEPIGEQTQVSLRATPPLRAQDRFNLVESQT